MKKIALSLLLCVPLTSVSMQKDYSRLFPAAFSECAEEYKAFLAQVEDAPDTDHTRLWFMKCKVLQEMKELKDLLAQVSFPSDAPQFPTKIGLPNGKKLHVPNKWTTQEMYADEDALYANTEEFKLMKECKARLHALHLRTSQLDVYRDEVRKRREESRIAELTALLEKDIVFFERMARYHKDESGLVEEFEGCEAAVKAKRAELEALKKKPKL